jgi:hypothetical protein
MFDMKLFALFAIAAAFLRPQQAAAQSITTSPGATLSLAFNIAGYNGPCVGCPTTFAAYPIAAGSGGHFHGPSPGNAVPRPVVHILSSRTDNLGYTHSVFTFPWYAGNYPVTACSSVTVNVCTTVTVQVTEPTSPFIGMSAASGKFILSVNSAHRNGHLGLDMFTNAAMQSIAAVNFLLGGPPIMAVRGSLYRGGRADTIPDLGLYYHFEDDDHLMGVALDVMPPALPKDVIALDTAVNHTKGFDGLPCEDDVLNGLIHIWCE